MAATCTPSGSSTIAMSSCLSVPKPAGMSAPRRVARCAGRHSTVACGRAALTARGPLHACRDRSGRRWRRVHHVPRRTVQPQPSTTAAPAALDRLGQLVAPFAGHRAERDHLFRLQRRDSPRSPATARLRSARAELVDLGEHDDRRDAELAEEVEHVHGRRSSGRVARREVERCRAAAGSCRR